MTFDLMSVEVTCVTLPKDHCVQVPWECINVCGYNDQYCKIPHTTYITTRQSYAVGFVFVIHCGVTKNPQCSICMCHTPHNVASYLWFYPIRYAHVYTLWGGSLIPCFLMCSPPRPAEAIYVVGITPQQQKNPQRTICMHESPHNVHSQFLFHNVTVLPCGC